MLAAKWGQFALVLCEVECYCGSEHHGPNSCGQGGRVMGGARGSGGGSGGGRDHAKECGGLKNGNALRSVRKRK